MLETAEQVGRGKGAVERRRQARSMGDFCHRRHVEHLEARIAEDLAEHQPRLGPDRRLPRRVVARIDEGGGDAEPRQGMDEDVVAAAIDVARGDDMAALPHQGDDSEMQGCLARAGADRADTACTARPSRPGGPGCSPNTSRGSGRIAACLASWSRGSTKVVVMPNRGRVWTRML